MTLKNNLRTLAVFSSLSKSSTCNLFYACTADHAYPFKHLKKQLLSARIRAETFTYEKLLRRKSLERGTYIFTDLDRLSTTELAASSAIYRQLSSAGLCVLNDPARTPRRDELISRLYQAGINDYRCYRPAIGETPERFPVFLRTNSGHRGVMGDLLHSRKNCDAALQDALEQGYPVTDLIFVEYAAEPNPKTGFFAKRAAYFIAGEVIPANTVNERGWSVKLGESNLAHPDDYAQERAELDDYPFEDWVRTVFRHADIDFGRVDFGNWNGRPQAYEINTNPTISLGTKHENPDRSETLGLIADRLQRRLISLATAPNGRAIDIREAFKRNRRGVPRRV